MAITFRAWLHAKTAPPLPRRSQEFLHVSGAPTSEQQRFDLLQLKRDIATDAMNEILRDILGYTQSDKAAQLFAILQKYGEQLEQGIIKLTKEK